MLWWRVVGQEPLRSRLLVVAAGVLAIAGPVSVAWVDRSSPPWWFHGLGVAFMLLPLAIVVVMAAVGIWAMTPESRLSRPVRFQLTDSGFAVAPLVPYGLTAAMPVILAGWVVAGFPQRWGEAPTPDSTALIYDLLIGGFTLVLVVATAAVVVSAWRGFAIELTPSGLYWRGPLLYRSIPWEALAPGGPSHPEPRTNRLDLAVTRPDLVVQRGVRLRHRHPSAPGVAAAS